MTVVNRSLSYNHNSDSESKICYKMVIAYFSTLLSPRSLQAVSWCQKFQQRERSRQLEKDQVEIKVKIPIRFSTPTCAVYYNPDKTVEKRQCYVKVGLRPPPNIPPSRSAPPKSVVALWNGQLVFWTEVVGEGMVGQFLLKEILHSKSCWNKIVQGEPWWRKNRAVLRLTFA